MPAAKRADPITVQKLSRTLNELTGELSVDTWEDFFPCFAEVLVKGQREFTRAGIVNADVSHIVRVPRSDETDQIKQNEFRIILHDTAEILQIETAFRRDASGREIEMLCRS